MNKIKKLYSKSRKIIKEQGFWFFLFTTKTFLYSIYLKKVNKFRDKFYFDVLFINGCGLPHPSRYRVSHQIEQLFANNCSAGEVFYLDLDINMVKNARAFVFFRCPITPTVEAFIKKAQENNKVTFFDVDDLVIDTKYTDKIEFLKTLTQDELNLYNDGVNRMKATMELCDYAITTTPTLRKEMQNYIKDVYLNKNVASEEMVKLSIAASKKICKDDTKVILGYFSGSISHNPDFELILPTIVDLMKKHKNLYLKIAGILDYPPQLKEFKDRILTAPFVDWKKLPEIIASVDINLAPLENTIFNEAKSENKWTEAALCNVVTVASRLGAFQISINNGIDGFLAEKSNEWFDILDKLIEDKELREKTAKNAFNRVKKEYVTTYTGLGLTEFIESKMKRNFFFVLPSTNVSGGVNVVLKHCSILKNKGYDVSIINMANDNNDINNKNGSINVLSKNQYNFYGKIDSAVATLWSTNEFFHSYSNILNKYYLVQGFETDFSEYGNSFRFFANSTYNSYIPINYVTISKWCESWLKNDYYQNPKYAPNGIDLSNFNIKQRTFEGKIKILVEGNCEDAHKNVDESFIITNKLDPNKFEIHYLSYKGKPKDWYRVDKFYNAVPFDKVGEIYANCDVLIKSSILESFSYPPLEMMATGGISVVVPNDGNAEFLVDEFNCLLYPQGDIKKAISQINRICEDSKLRDKLIKNGRNTAESRSWDIIEQDIINLYT